MESLDSSLARDLPPHHSAHNSLTDTMLFDESDTDHLKAWLIKRLEDTSDADGDVLADYVLALVKTDEPVDQVRANCVDALKDFLSNDTDKFVDDVFTALEAKSYLPGYVAPLPIQDVPPTFNAPTGPSAASYNRSRYGPTTGARGDQSRKRSYNEHEGNEARDEHDVHYNRANGGERPVKQSRRGGRGGREGQQNGFGANFSFQQQPPLSMPTPPPGFPPLDPTNPMSAILAMQAMGFPALPGFPQFPSPGSPPGQSTSPAGLGASRSGQNESGRSRERCKDYDTKGYCAAGSMCPYEHGSDHIVVSEETTGYDPNDASLGADFVSQPKFESSRPLRGNSQYRGRGSQRGGRGANTHGHRGGRAGFSSAAPNFNQSITSIVVEQIPEDKFNEDEIRAFFGEFGEIEEVKLQAYKRLGIVKFKNYANARRAYESPKVVFDNRFVKVYWYKPEATQDGSGESTAVEDQPQAPAHTEDEEMVDLAEVAEKQAVAQRAHEEKARKQKEADALREELDKKIKAQAEERKRLMEKLAARTAPSARVAGAANSPASNTETKNGPLDGSAKAVDANEVAATSPSSASSKSASQTETLRAKLAALEAEATTLGINSEEQSHPTYPTAQYGRGRGGFNPYSRGGYRGRGGAWRGGPTALAGGGVARLDNRPKSVEVRAKEGGVDFGDERVLESLRAHLFGVGEFASITPSNPSPTTDPTKHDSATVAFNQRYVAEMFVSSSSNIPGIGATTLAWIPNAPATTSTSASASMVHGASSMGGADSSKTINSGSGSVVTTGAAPQFSAITSAPIPIPGTTKTNMKLSPAAMDFTPGKAAPGTVTGSATEARSSSMVPPISGSVTGAVKAKMNGSVAAGATKDKNQARDTEMRERDYDIADDDDRWMR